MTNADPIVCVCPNAALEITYIVGQSGNGVSTKAIWEAGGKGSNVARILRRLGRNLRLVACMGGHVGSWIAARLTSEDVEVEVVDTGVETRCSAVIVSPGVTPLVFREDGPRVRSKIKKQFLERVRSSLRDGALIAVSGSVPTGMGSSVYEELGRLSQEFKSRLIVDCSGVNLLAALRGRPYFVKQNVHETEVTFKRNFRSETDLVVALKLLCAKGAENATITLGAEGSISLLDGQLIRVSLKGAPRAVNATGAGDAFMAGLASSISDHASLVDALETATAVASASTEEWTSGSVSRGAVARHRRFVSIVRIGHVQR